MDVPFQWPANPALASWVAVQRQRGRGKQGTSLTPSQLSRLLGCGCELAAAQAAECWHPLLRLLSGSPRACAAQV